MKIEEVIKILEFIFGSEEKHIRYSIEWENNKISCLRIEILNKEWGEWDLLKKLYFNNGELDLNYNRRKEIKEQIEKLQEELKNLK